MKPEGENVFRGDDAIKMQKLLDALENLDDVQEIYTTAMHRRIGKPTMQLP